MVLKSTFLKQSRPNVKSHYYAGLSLSPTGRLKGKIYLPMIKQSGLRSVGLDDIHPQGVCAISKPLILVIIISPA